VIAAVVALFAVAAIAVFLFFDPSDFRDDIAEAVKKSTGRDLVIDGDVSLQVFPWLAVEVGHAALGNAPGFGDEAFAEFDRAQLSVRLMPLLLRREVTVGTAVLDALRLNLAVDSNGRSNWDDLVPE
jgi:AsmA protein